MQTTVQTIVLDKNSKRPDTIELFRAFERLNREWLEEFFVVEDVDKELFRNVEEKIINQDGTIAFIKYENEIVGCGALLFHTPNKVELTKMAVTQKERGKGFGRVLMQLLIDVAAKRKITALELVTNSSLKPAIKLYESFGFKKNGNGEECAYDRGDYEMLLMLGS